MIHEHSSRPGYGTSMFCLIGFGVSLLLMSLMTCCDGRVHQGTHFCETYNRSHCADCPPTIQDCSKLRDGNTNKSLDKPDVYMLCYSTWHATNYSELVYSLKGCWLNTEDCKGKPRCEDTRSVAALYYCCCDGNMCNRQAYHNPIYTDKDIKALGPGGRTNVAGKPAGQSTSGVDEPEVVRRASDYELSKTLLCSIVPIVGVFFVVVTIYFMWRRHQRNHMGHHQLPTMDPNLVQTPTDQTLDIQLLEHKAKGRFGYVWKAKLLDQYVAVKMFPMADKKSFSQEVDIYKRTNMKHDNILRFIASEVKEDSSYAEFLLITEYHERGSLYDYLKANTITWAQLCRIGESMTCGLAYLHDEIPATYNTGLKPAIAHRDFKSKNVLIRSDMTACIADFGLAIAFEPSLGVNETHTQVGTRRYMAPEVLEGAICFNMDSFLRIDMYACSLVLWELMTRCTCVEDVVDDYRLPFEAEVGLQPSLEEMQPLVVEQKQRPLIKASWYNSPGMASLVDTVEECWDQDAEARLLAGCVHDRIAQFSWTINAGGDNNNTSANTTLPLSSPPPPFPGPQQPQLYIHEQHPQHCQYQQQPHSSPGVNSSLISNNSTQHHRHYHPHHIPLPPQQQQPPPAYVPNNLNDNGGIQSPPRAAVIIDHNIDTHNSMMNSVNNTLSSSPRGMNGTTPRDLSTC